MEKKEDPDGATGRAADVNVNKPRPSVYALSGEVRRSGNVIETPVGLRQLVEASGERDFSGFREERGNMRRIINVERELRCMKELISSIVEKQDDLIRENKELRNKFSECESALRIK